MFTKEHILIQGKYGAGELVTGRRTVKSALRLVVLAGLVFCAAPVRANTYLYSISAGDFFFDIAAAAPAGGSASMGIFGIFLQPTNLGSTYTFVSESAPNPGAPDGWAATTMIDPSLGPGTWLAFTKGPTQTSVSLISHADPGTGNIFLGKQYHDNLAAPSGWGTTTGTVTTIIPDTATYHFVVDSPVALPLSAIQFKGIAAVIHAGSSAQFPNCRFGICGDKTEDISFTYAAPEPGTWILFGLGLTSIAAGQALRKRRGWMKSGSSQQGPDSRS
jgi:hypothetical protein